MTIMCKAFTRNVIFTAGYKALQGLHTHAQLSKSIHQLQLPSLKLSWVQTNIKHTNTL